MGDTRYVYDTKDTVRYRFPTHINDLVMDRAESETSEVIIVVLKRGESPTLHVHHNTEQIFYLLDGHGKLQIGEDNPQFFPVKPGDLVRVPPHSLHQIICESEEMTYLGIDCFVGGRPEAEPTWESHVRVMCADHGWDFDNVRVDK